MPFLFMKPRIKQVYNKGYMNQLHSIDYIVMINKYATCTADNMEHHAGVKLSIIILYDYYVSTSLLNFTV